MINISDRKEKCTCCIQLRNNTGDGNSPSREKLHMSVCVVTPEWKISESSSGWKFVAGVKK